MKCKNCNCVVYSGKSICPRCVYSDMLSEEDEFRAKKLLGLFVRKTINNKTDAFTPKEICDEIKHCMVSTFGKKINRCDMSEVLITVRLHGNDGDFKTYCTVDIISATRMHLATLGKIDDEKYIRRILSKGSVEPTHDGVKSIMKKHSYVE